MKYFLINKDTSEVFELKDQMVFGRRPNCDLIFKDDLVSGFHCKFHYCKTHFIVEDLKASNPILINGIGIGPKERKKLSHNDVITVGSSSYIFTDKEKHDDSSYKTMVLNKIKVHETVITQPSKNTSTPVLKTKDIRKDLKNLQYSIMKLDEHKSRREIIKKQISEIYQDNTKPGQYDLDELNTHIEKYNHKIKELSQKRDELEKVLSSELNFKELENELEELERDIMSLEKENLSEKEQVLKKQLKKVS